MGTLIRFILLLLAIWVVIQLVRRWRSDNNVRRTPGRLNAAMSRCAHCGTFVPASEAIVRGERSYCSTQHLEAAARDRP